MELNQFLEYPLLTYSTARSANFKFQYDLLNQISKYIPGVRAGQVRQDPEVAPLIRKKVFELIREDVQNTVQGLYPVQVFQPESPLRHIRRLGQIFFDGIGLSQRRATQRARSFSKTPQDLLEEVPEYYRRNFHFQTDGYLSDRSAELYDHQVELLFGGMADPMRRLVISPMKEFFKNNPSGGGLTFLELGCGTGRSTRNVRLAFPKARIIATDLSEPYLRAARKNLDSFSRLDFMRADGGDLPFSDEKFDAVYSVFMLHETPLQARKKILSEAMRVLKKNGFLGIIDSAQLGDIPQLNEILKNFPLRFHEPYYTNYIKTPLERLVKAQEFKLLGSHLGFLSKVVWAKK